MGDVERWCLERLRERLSQRGGDGASTPRGSVSERVVSAAFRATVALGPMLQYGMRLLLALVVCTGLGGAPSTRFQATAPISEVYRAAATLRGN